MYFCISGFSHFLQGFSERLDRPTLRVQCATCLEVIQGAVLHQDLEARLKQTSKRAKSFSLIVIMIAYHLSSSFENEVFKYYIEMQCTTKCFIVLRLFINTIVIAATLFSSKTSGKLLTIAGEHHCSSPHAGSTKSQSLFYPYATFSNIFNKCVILS